MAKEQLEQLEDDEPEKYVIEGEASVVASEDDSDEESGASADEGNANTPEEQQEDANASDEDREAIRERRRQERHDKKEAQREREAASRREKDALRRENQELAQRLANLEKRSVGNDFAQLDSAIEQTGRATQYLKEQIKLATEASDGTTVAEATEKLFQASRHLEHLNNLKRNAVQQTRSVEQRSPIDPVVRQRAVDWAGKHSWYDPDSGDSDSKVALTIDNSMAAEGWDPRHPEYWDELDSRLKRYLPHRYARVNGNGGGQRSNHSPVTGSGREGGNPQGGGGWILSKERVQAIKEAGKWEDTAQRNRMIKQYQAYDKAAKPR